MNNLIKIILLIFSISMLNCKSDDNSSTQDILVVGSFEFNNDAGFRLIELEGIDSYVGYLQNSDIRIDFDFGWYTSPIENPSTELFEVFTENINGHYVQILKAKIPNAESTRVHLYKIQDSIDSPFGYNSLTMNSDDLTEDQQNVVMELYNSWNSTN